MKYFLCVVFCIQFLDYVLGEIGGTHPKNMLAHLKPVGGQDQSLLGLTELPSPMKSKPISGRRALPPECKEKPKYPEWKGPDVAVNDYYYDERRPHEITTVIIPDHIDEMQFQVTNPVPYYTVGSVPPVGYHPTTQKLSSCEKIYVEHQLQNDYSEQSVETSEESVEMIKVPVDEMNNRRQYKNLQKELFRRLSKLYEKK